MPSRIAFKLSFFVAVAALAGIAPALAFSLVTPEEAAAAQSAHARGFLPGPRHPGENAAALPQIEVESPALDAPVKSPVNIKLKFVPPPGAVIVPETFRAYYGFLGIDITDRIRAHAAITQAGLTLENAELPKGTHELTLSVRDSADRAAELRLSVTIQ
jgi:hypothetical protein